MCLIHLSRDLSQRECEFWCNTGARTPLQLALMISPIYLLFPTFLSQKVIGKEMLYNVRFLTFICAKISSFLLRSRSLWLWGTKDILLFSITLRKSFGMLSFPWLTQILMWNRRLFSSPSLMKFHGWNWPSSKGLTLNGSSWPSRHPRIG